MLPEELRSTYDQMQLAKVTQQRWSDGLVLYTSLADNEVKCPMNSLFTMFGTAWEPVSSWLRNESPFAEPLTLRGLWNCMTANSMAPHWRKPTSTRV